MWGNQTLFQRAKRYWEKINIGKNYRKKNWERVNIDKNYWEKYWEKVNIDKIN